MVKPAGARRSRPARIVTVCVAGRPTTQERHNQNRIELVSAVIHQIDKRPEWDGVHAVLFPAGYFRLASWFGPLGSADRCDLLKAAERDTEPDGGRSAAPGGGAQGRHRRLS